MLTTDIPTRFPHIYLYNSSDSAVLLLFGRISIENALETYIIYDNIYDKYIVDTLY